jgi:histidine triad (HIT) family protein
MKDCIFCKIINGEISSPNKIYEDNKVLGLLDIHPVNKGHVVVIPKKHSEDILHTEDELLKNTMLIVKKLANILKKVVAADGINININNGREAGQIIFHPHVHIVPRFVNDGLKLWSGRKYKEDEMKEVAQKIKAHLEKL